MSRQLSFSEELRSALSNYGWHPDRSVPILDWMAELKQQGFQAFPLAEEALRTLET
jgi:hypothetical protein